MQTLLAEGPELVIEGENRQSAAVTATTTRATAIGPLIGILDTRITPNDQDEP